MNQNLIFLRNYKPLLGNELGRLRHRNQFRDVIRHLRLRRQDECALCRRLSFYTAGRAVASQVGSWDGTNWSALGAGIVGKVSLGRVAAVALNGSDFYVGGPFTNAGGLTASNIAKWNGTAWLPVGGGVNNTVTALAADGADVYAGGSFTIAGGVGASRIAKWNGSSWSALSSGLDISVTALAVGSDGNSRCRLE